MTKLLIFLKPTSSSSAPSAQEVLLKCAGLSVMVLSQPGHLEMARLELRRFASQPLPLERASWECQI